MMKWNERNLAQYIGCLATIDHTDGFLVIYSKMKVFKMMNGRGPEGMFMGAKGDEAYVSFKGAFIDCSININYVKVI